MNVEKEIHRHWASPLTSYSSSSPVSWAASLPARLRVPLLVGYVAAGVLVGPYTAGPTVVQVHDIEQLADIGVALLLFSLGLEMSFRDLQPVRRIALIGGPLQIVLTTALAAVAGVKALGMPVTEAIWFGAMISLSSTVVVLKTLSAAGVTSTLASRVMIGLLVVQDLAVVPMLVILPQIGNLDDLPMKLARSIGIATVFLAAVVILGTRLLPPLLRRVLALGSRELFLVSVVAIGVGVGYATQSIGLSFALGAFVAGLILGESEFSHQALSDVVPVRDIFGLLFFVTVGMLLDPTLCHCPCRPDRRHRDPDLPGKILDPGRLGEGVRLRQHGPLDCRAGPVSGRRVLVRARAERSWLRAAFEAYLRSCADVHHRHHGPFPARSQHGASPGARMAGLAQAGRSSPHGSTFHRKLSESTSSSPVMDGAAKPSLASSGRLKSRWSS